MANLLNIQKRKYFGTDGIRGSISRETNPEFILKLGWAAGKVFEEEGIKAVVIGKDTRISGYMLETALQSGIIAAGMDVRLVGPMPTPAVSYLASSFREIPAITLAAIFAKGIPKAFETKGIVLDALGLASIINTLSSLIAN